MIYSNKGGDRLFGGSGSGALFEGPESDTVFGLSGADQVYGNRQDNTLYGGPGADSLLGSQRNNLLYGQYGHVRFNGKCGDNILFGEDGVDTIVIYKGRSWVIAFSSAEDKIENADPYTAITQTVSGGNLVLTISDGDTLILLDMTTTLSEVYFV